MPLPLIEELIPAPSAPDACERLAGLPFRLLLDSAATGTRLGRYSYLMADPVTVVRSRGASIESVDMATGRVEPYEGGVSQGSTRPDATSLLRELLRPFATPAVPGLPPFQGGAAGYLAYDWGYVLEDLPTPPFDDLAMDDIVLGIYDWVVAWDHESDRAWILSTGLMESEPSARQARATRRLADVKRWLHGEPVPASPSMPAEEVRRTGPAPSYPVEGGWWDPAIALRSSFTRPAYLAAVARVRDYIFAGDIFQTNLSQRFEAPLTESPWSLYCRLRRRNPAPFAAFMELPGATVLSASPERFLRVDVDGRVETRPIKGTRPRGVGPEHDAALGQALAESAKDRAENLMIVDLMRNDLSRVCLPGTVRVPELFALERYATVHHLVSTVVGQLAPGTDALDLLRAAFPGGSITGAPKLRAMEIIAELEPSWRGVYCGSLGYWSVSGALETSIAIRTAVARAGRVYFNAGGGIVADSSPEQEYRETLDKARGIIDALAVPV